MPFKFFDFCELLNALAENKHQLGQVGLRHHKADHIIVKEWYSKYKRKIERCGPPAIAFLSAFFPERRPDRTYNLQDKRLYHIFGRALGLGTSRLRELQSWQRNDGEDFAICVRRVISFTEPCIPAGGEVTLEELDEALTKIAANTISSAPKIRALAEFQRPVDILTPIIQRLTSNEAQWFVRMIRKSYSPIQIPEYVALHQFHFMLPKLLEVQNDFEAAINTLSLPQLTIVRPKNNADEKSLMAAIAHEIDPVLGTMIRRQPFWKARSIKHCVKMAEKRVMSIERKYDGEYCQIHIDASHKRAKIQIFSKNGRDATSDRLALQGAIKAGLRLDCSDSKIKSRAILEGELLVYGTVESKILPFHHVRKHVRHGGRRIGTEKDSPKKMGEHPMIVFYDILLLDNNVLLTVPHKQRRALLKGVVDPIPGYAQIVERAMIDFASRSAPGILRTAFGAAIRNRWEGFVLKGLEDPYFDWMEYNRSIKLKKDYIGGLGDSVDLCIVGGRRNPRDEIGLNLGALTWTSFYVAALVNKDEVRRFDERPVFKILDCLGPGSMSKDDILALNSEGKMVEHAYVAESEFMAIQNPRANISPPTHIFKSPLVVGLMGAGYERPQSADFWILRFPRRAGAKMRVHRDRDVADTVSFNELQVMAQESMNNVEEMESQEDARWIERLLAADPKSGYNVDKSQSTSTPQTLRSETTIDLTPALTVRSTSQQTPVMIRVDSEELTAAEIFGKYAESCPNLRTPSRRSDGTLTASSSGSSRVSKRDFGGLQESPSPKTSRKRQRVEFEENTSNFHYKTRSALSNLPNLTSSQQQGLLESSNFTKGMTRAKMDASAPKGSDVKPSSINPAASRVSSPPKKRLRTCSQDEHLSDSSDSSVPTAPKPVEDTLQIVQRRTAEIETTLVPEAICISCSPAVPDEGYQKVRALVELVCEGTALVFTKYANRRRYEGIIPMRLQPYTPHRTPDTRLYTRSLDFFVTQVVLQSRIDPVKNQDRIHCVAFFPFSDADGTVQHLREIAERFTLDRDLTKDLAASKNEDDGASILICDSNKTYTEYHETGENGYVDRIMYYASGVMMISKKPGDNGAVKVKMFWYVKDRKISTAA